jgi:ABC-type tungstate transport system substrate-binding protein
LLLILSLLLSLLLSWRPPLAHIILLYCLRIFVVKDGQMVVAAPVAAAVMASAIGPNGFSVS